MASKHYELDDGSRFGFLKSDVEVVEVPAYFNFSFSLSDLKVAKSRKPPRKGYAEFLAQENVFWGSIREVGHPDPRSLTLNSNSLSARSLVPSLGIWEIERKGSSALACEDTKGRRVCPDHY